MARDKPFETNYPRWRHIKHGYIVTIEGVTNHLGEKGYFSQVVVRGSRASETRLMTWSADTFRKNFEPYGRKKKPKTALDQVVSDSDDYLD